jgi:hypothetical protein
MTKDEWQDMCFVALVLECIVLAALGLGVVIGQIVW